jgi:hypothetical protein
MVRLHDQASLHIALVAACVLATGCTDDPSPPDPAPVVWVGEHIEVATNGEAVACGGSWEYLDAFVGAALGEMALQAEGPFRYYLLTPDELEAVNDPWMPVGSRHARGRRVYTNVAVDTHELVHAIRHDAVRNPLPGVTFFEEGLAVMYQQDARPLYPDRDVMAALRSISDLRAYMPGEHYGLAGHFTRFLASEHGIEPVVAFVDDQVEVGTVDDIEALFAEHFGESLGAAVERYPSVYPSCSHLARTRHVVECTQPPVEPVDQAIHMSYELACDDPDVLGPADGRMWRSFTFDVTEAGRYSLVNIFPPHDFTLELVDCERGCLGSTSSPPEGGTIYATPDLEPGRYLVRLSRTVDAPGSASVIINGFN